MSAPEDVQDVAEVLALHCNFVKHDGRPCGQRVCVGWLTSCAHLFCDDHAREWFGCNVDCPVCTAPGHEPTRVMKVDLASLHKRRRMVALGFQPFEVFAAASEAFEFWASQKARESTWHVQAIDRLQKREHKMREAYEHRAEQVEGIMRELEEQRVSAEKRLEASVLRGEQLASEIREVRERLEDVHRRHRELQAADAFSWARQAGVGDGGDWRLRWSERRSGSLGFDGTTGAPPSKPPTPSKRQLDGASLPRRTFAGGGLHSALGVASAGVGPLNSARPTRRRRLH